MVADIKPIIYCKEWSSIDTLPTNLTHISSKLWLLWLHYGQWCWPSL